MPGKRISDHQVLTYKAKRRAHTQAGAASKAGISERSARRIESLAALPSQRPARQWRTRPDPLAGVWEAELLPLLQTNPHPNGVTLLEELQRRHPGEYGPSALRTLQRPAAVMASDSRPRVHGLFRARTSARKARSFGLHRCRRFRRDDRGHAVRASVVPGCVGAFGLAVNQRR